jgi:hypothetical protein
MQAIDAGASMVRGIPCTVDGSFIPSLGKRHAQIDRVRAVGPSSQAIDAAYVGTREMDRWERLLHQYRGALTSSGDWCSGKPSCLAA